MKSCLTFTVSGSTISPNVVQVGGILFCGVFRMFNTYLVIALVVLPVYIVSCDPILLQMAFVCLLLDKLDTILREIKRR